MKGIPEQFYKAEKERATAKTVGELIEQLKRLPNKLPLCSFEEDHMTLVVYNVSRDNPHLCIEEFD